MESDGDFQLLHHYVQKGITFEYLANMPSDEKLLMKASMEKYYEDEKAKWGST